MYISPELRSQPPSFEYDEFELPANVELVFHLNAHQISTDLPAEPELRHNIELADAVILEASSVVDPAVFLGKISRGDLKTYRYWRDYFASGDVAYGEWLGAFTGALYDAKTPVTSIDINPLSLSMKSLAKAQGLLIDAEKMARSENDIIAASDKAATAFRTYRARDQEILANIKPRLEELTTRSKFLKQKRTQGVAQVDVYYGNIHRSLFDALVHKNESRPIEGFFARIHPNSVPNSVAEAGYATFLRTGQVSPELLIMDACRTSLIASLFVYNPSFRNKPMTKLEVLAADLSKDRTYAEVLKMGKILRYQPDLISGPAFEL